MSDYEYPEMRRWRYGDRDSAEGQAVFVPVCEQCFRFVKPDPTIRFTEYGISDEPNATCAKHGRVRMLFEGFL